MDINLNNPIIAYSEAGKPFPYVKLFLKVTAKYIEEYKNVPYERLTEKDQSVALARIIKKMECNGVPLRSYFEKEFEKWDTLENSEKIMQVVETVSKDMFCCFDRNLDDADGYFKRSNRIYCINDGEKRDYFAYLEKDKKSLFGKAKPKSVYHTYFAELIEKSQLGLLTKNTDEEKAQ